MAFPTSSLTNNQVHKEGNRAFVYDSALVVWDQVRETDRTEFPTETELSKNVIKSGEIGSRVTFPRGHVIKMSTFSRLNGSAIQQTGNNSYQDTGLEVSHVTAESSTNSYLIWDVWIGMSNIAASTNARLDVTVRTVSNSTYTAAESICGGAGYGFTYWNNQVADVYQPYGGKVFCGLEPGMDVPNSKTTWAAGETLYFRMFMSLLTGDSNMLHGDSIGLMQVTEVAR